MTVVEKHIPKGHPNRPGKKLEAVKAIVFHFTDNDRPTATDTMNAAYFARPYKIVNGKPYEVDRFGNVLTQEVIVKDRNGNPILDEKGNKQYETVPVDFRHGSTQIICDMDSVTEAIPPDEAAWGCGDRHMPWTEEFKGQKPLAKYLCNNRQNYMVENVEICNNNAVPNSDDDWRGACTNAAAWARQYILDHNLTVNIKASLNPETFDGKLNPGEIALLRHSDLTGKICPKPFVDDQKKWYDFVHSIIK